MKENLILELKLTRQIQRRHPSLPKPQHHRFPQRVPALLHQYIHDDLQHGRALREPGVGVQAAIARVGDDVVAPVETAEVKEILRSLEGDAGCFREVQLAGESGEGVVIVSQAVQEEENVGGGVVGGRCCGGWWC